MKFPSTPPSQSPTPMADHLPQKLQSEAATKIQSLYRAHMIRNLYKKISSVDSVANHLQRLIQRQEIVDSLRNDERQKLKMNDTLMGLLLKLDSVPGIDLSIREARRKVNRRIIGLQEILDGISEARIDDYDDAYGGWDRYGYRRDLDKVVEQMEEQRSATQVSMSSLRDSSTTVNVANVVPGRNKGKGPMQCYSCEEFGHITRNCNKKFCNYCKQIGHFIKECPKRPQNRRAQPFQVNVVCAPSMTNNTNQSVLTPEMVQQMIFSAFCAFGLQGSGTGKGDQNGA